MSKVSTLSVFSDLVKETQAAIDEIVPGKVKVSVTHCDELNRYSITGEAELRMRVSYDYDSDMIKPAKVKLVTMPNRQFEDVADADLLISYYKQRAAHMMATDEEVLAFKGHPAMFTTS
jgi:hypothetical protein